MLVRTDRGLWAVADGMGGHDAGDVASAKVTEALLRLPIVYGLDDLVESAIAALQRVNHELIEMGGPTEARRTIGSTVVGLAIAERTVPLLLGGRQPRLSNPRTGEIVQLTRDHSLVQDLVDAGMLDPEEAHDHPECQRHHARGRRGRGAQGRHGERRREAGRSVPAGKRRFDEAGGRCRDWRRAFHRTRPAEAAEQLIETVLSRGAPDNVTMIIVSPA